MSVDQFLYLNAAIASVIIMIILAHWIRQEWSGVASFLRLEKKVRQMAIDWRDRFKGWL